MRPRNHLINFLPRYRSAGINANDSSSITSELTVDDLDGAIPQERKYQSQLELHPASCSSKKRVNFDLRSNQSYENHMISVEDCASLWYSASEQQCFKESSNYLARSILKSGCCSTATIEKVFRACVVIEFDISTSVLTKGEEREFRNLFRSCTGIEKCLGMERRVVRCLAKDKQMRRKILVDIVYEQQDEEHHHHRGRGSTDDMSSSGHRSCMGIDAWEDRLREECEAISLASRLFARHLAQAQAAAALEAGDALRVMCEEAVLESR